MTGVSVFPHNLKRLSASTREWGRGGGGEAGREEGMEGGIRWGRVRGWGGRSGWTKLKWGCVRGWAGIHRRAAG